MKTTISMVLCHACGSNSQHASERVLYMAPAHNDDFSRNSPWTVSLSLSLPLSLANRDAGLEK